MGCPQKEVLLSLLQAIDMCSRNRQLEGTRWASEGTPRLTNTWKKHRLPSKGNWGNVTQRKALRAKATHLCEDARSTDRETNSLHWYRLPPEELQDTV